MLLQPKQTSLIQVFLAKKRFEQEIAMELNAEIKSLKEEHTDWPMDYIRVYAQGRLEDAISQAENFQW